jgi:hypothetical protein
VTDHHNLGNPLNLLPKKKTKKILLSFAFKKKQKNKKNLGNQELRDNHSFPSTSSNKLPTGTLDWQRVRRQDDGALVLSIRTGIKQHESDGLLFQCVAKVTESSCHWKQVSNLSTLRLKQVNWSL